MDRTCENCGDTFKEGTGLFVHIEARNGYGWHVDATGSLCSDCVKNTILVRDVMKRVLDGWKVNHGLMADWPPRPGTSRKQKNRKE